VQLPAVPRHFLDRRSALRLEVTLLPRAGLAPLFPPARVDLEVLRLLTEGRFEGRFELARVEQLTRRLASGRNRRLRGLLGGCRGVARVALATVDCFGRSLGELATLAARGQRRL
jgi:hypothetical protein